MIIEFSPAAVQDIADAVAYYDQQRAGLGSEFIADLQQSVDFV